MSGSYRFGKVVWNLEGVHVNGRLSTFLEGKEFVLLK